MKKLLKSSVLLSVFAIAMVFHPMPVKADGHENLTVKHNINGRSLGLEKDLPVDVFVNDVYAFTFSFGQTFETFLPAGEYSIKVKLEGTEMVVMSLGPVEIAEGDDVMIRATLGAEKAPTLRAKIK